MRQVAVISVTCIYHTAYEIASRRFKSSEMKHCVDWYFLAQLVFWDWLTDPEGTSFIENAFNYLPVDTA